MPKNVKKQKKGKKRICFLKLITNILFRERFEKKPKNKNARSRFGPGKKNRTSLFPKLDLLPGGFVLYLCPRVSEAPTRNYS